MAFPPVPRPVRPPRAYQRKAPAFRIKPPWDPATGKLTALQRPPDLPRLSTMRVKAIYDDYLECEGWEPDIRAYVPSVHVAKPPLLRASNRIRQIRFPEYTEDFYDAAGVREAVFHNSFSHRMFQRVWPPYFVGDLIVAAKMDGLRGQAVADPTAAAYQQTTPAESGLPDDYPVEMLYDADNEPILWVDLNVGARTWTPFQTAMLQWARPQENWRKNSGDPRVSCKLVAASPRRSSSTVVGDAFWVYLPRTGSDRDPNVIAGSNVPFLVDEDDVAICQGDYLDAKIGSIQLWCKTAAEIPQGWALMNGTLNAAPDGSGIAMVVGTQQYFALATDVDLGGGVGAVGTAVRKDGKTASETVIVPPHDATVIDPHDCSVITAHAADVTGSGGLHGHSGATGGGSAHTHYGETYDAGQHNHTGATGPDGEHEHTGQTQGAGSHDHGGATSGGSGTTTTESSNIDVLPGFAQVSDSGHDHTLTDAGPVDVGIVLYVASSGATGVGQADVTDLGHDHPLDDNQHSHSAGTLAFTISSVGNHAHVIISEDLTTEPDHTHSITPVLDHKHEIKVGGLNNESTHTHTFTTDLHYGHQHSTPAHTHSGMLTHSFTEDLTHDPVDIIPEFKNLMFIERIDNSAD
jgi:hypothetical protein